MLYWFACWSGSICLRFASLSSTSVHPSGRATALLGTKASAPDGWIIFDIVSVILRRGEEPYCGHYQSWFRTGGSRFLTEDCVRAIPYPHVPDWHGLKYLSVLACCSWSPHACLEPDCWNSLQLFCSPGKPFLSWFDSNMSGELFLPEMKKQKKTRLVFINVC